MKFFSSILTCPLPTLHFPTRPVRPRVQFSSVASVHVQREFKNLDTKTGHLKQFRNLEIRLQFVVAHWCRGSMVPVHVSAMMFAVYAAPRRVAANFDIGLFGANFDLWLFRANLDLWLFRANFDLWLFRANFDFWFYFYLFLDLFLNSLTF